MARQFYWEPFNATYGPWYRMKEVRNGLSVPLAHGGHAVDAVVQPDMDREAWFWSVHFRKYRPKLPKEPDRPNETKKKAAKPKIPLPAAKYGGRVAIPGKEGLAEAMQRAETAFLTGRPQKGVNSDE